MKNVLVFPCGSEIGLEIYQSLRYSIHFKIIGASSVANHGAFVYKNYFELPFINDDNFLSQLNKLIISEKIDFIFPATDDAVVKLSEFEKNKSLSAKIVTSDFETCKICRSKKDTYDYFFNKLNIPVVYSKNYLYQNQNLFPIFAKPDIGQGSKGAYKINNIAELDFFSSKDSTLIYLEYLPGEEYTIDCFTDKNGVLRYVSGRLRARIINGISVGAKLVDDIRFKEMANIINDNLKFKGVWFFQVKEKDNKLFLMEISPRIAGGMGYSRMMGANLALLSLWDFSNHDIDIIINSDNIEMSRALSSKYKIDLSYNSVYIDLDDTIIINDKINIEAMSFIYQCINNNIKIYLITRHKNDPLITLQKYKIYHCFDEIIHIVDKNIAKSFYITDINSIFIDDSFAERKEVKSKHNIPVFDTSMINALIS